MSIFGAQAASLTRQVLNRLTAARAAALDLLDGVTLSSRAPGATALSTTNWPGTKADMVGEIGQVGGGLLPFTLSASDYVNQGAADPDVYNELQPNLGVVTTTLSGSGQGSYEDVIDITRAGTLYFLALASNGSDSNPDWDVRVTIDGSQRYSASHEVKMSGRDVGFTLCGALSFDSSGNLRSLQFGNIQFTTSLLVEVRRNNSGTSVRAAFNAQEAL